MAFVGSAILALILPPAQAVGIMLPLLMLMDVVTVGPFWRKWDSRSAWILIIGGIPGVFAGAVFFELTNDDALRFLIGAISIAFVGLLEAINESTITAAADPEDSDGNGISGQNGTINRSECVRC